MLMSKETNEQRAREKDADYEVFRSVVAGKADDDSPFGFLNCSISWHFLAFVCL